MTNPNLERVSEFWEHIRPWEGGYTHPGFGFFAARKEGKLILMHGRLFLNTTAPRIPRSQLQTENIAAGYFSLAELNLTPAELINKLLASESIETPIGEFRFPLEGERYSSFFTPFYQDTLTSGRKVSLLRISGDERQSYISQPNLDWELKAATTPYDSLSELMNEYWLGGYQGDYANIEVAAFDVVEVDVNSVVQGETAKPAVCLSNGLDHNECSLGYRVMLHGEVVKRGTISGSDMEWKCSERYQHGTGMISIPSGGVMQCFAAYKGVVQQQSWIADPSLSQNSRRAALEEFDDKLSVLRDFLFEEQKARKDARDFEVGVAWLAWMLGFSVAHSGATSRTSDATDILATTPNGNMALVECTIGHLKADTKLAKLLQRTETIRQRLDTTGNRHLRVLPVLVTSLTVDELKAELEQARKLGVFVVTREDLIKMLDRSIFVQNADRIYDEAENSLHDTQGLGF
jgi:hypothetical protein